MVSILVPTRKRPARLRAMVESVRATTVIMPQIFCYVDDDDDSYDETTPDGHVLNDRLFPDVYFVRGPRIVFSEMWNELYRYAKGDILVLGADDVVFKTPFWDEMIEQAFSLCPDKILCVHGTDGHNQENFGVMPCVHRKWIETVGYFAAPGFEGDYIDTWLNDVADMIGRRRYVPFLAEHMHVLWGTAEADDTWRETRERMRVSGATKLYEDRLPERQRDAEKLRGVMQPWA